MKLWILVFFLFFNASLVFAQELFPLNEPASSVPKGVFGLREFNEAYKEVSVYRNMFAARLMHGVLPQLSVMATVSASNHHGNDFPVGLASHTHPLKGTPVYSTGSFQRGVNYPYRFDGVYLYAKYRFLSLDGDHRHFRMAAYGEWSNVNVAHDEAEPNLLDDTKGSGGGVIATYLKNHFAVSLTSGVILPGKYNGFSPDTVGQPIVPSRIPTQMSYGSAVKYNLSFGYLLYPKTYEKYSQTNINVYLEFMGKSYQGAKIIQYGVVDVPISSPLLRAGNYVDICPGLQAIINSNLRIDFSTEFALINKSFAHFYPVFMLGVQRYFFIKKA